MTALRLLGAFLCGVLLYEVAVIQVGGILAAVTVPQSYFSWFDRSKVEVALALEQFALFAVPIAVLVAGGVLAVHRLLGGHTKSTLTAVFAGFAGCFILWVGVSALSVPAGLPSEPYPLGVRLRQLLSPPWWAVSGLLAPWVGFALAAWLLARKVSRAG